MKILRILKRMVGIKRKYVKKKRPEFKDRKNVMVIERLSAIPLDEVVNMAAIAKEFGCSRELVRQQASKITANTGREFLLKKDVPVHCKVCSKVIDRGHGAGYKQIHKCYECVQAKKAERASYWSYKYRLYGCKGCGTNKDRHRQDGFCQKCIYHNNPEQKEKIKIAVKNWRERNIEYCKKKCNLYSKSWYQKKKKEDPEYFRRIQREYLNRPGMREKQKQRMRERYHKLKQQKNGGSITNVPTVSEVTTSNSIRI